MKIKVNDNTKILTLNNFVKTKLIGATCRYTKCNEDKNKYDNKLETTLIFIVRNKFIVITEKKATKNNKLVLYTRTSKTYNNVNDFKIINDYNKQIASKEISVEYFVPKEHVNFSLKKENKKNIEIFENSFIDFIKEDTKGHFGIYIKYDNFEEVSRNDFEIIINDYA